jgi:hypothetical protein
MRHSSRALALCLLFVWPAASHAGDKIDARAVAAEIDAILEKSWAENKITPHAPASDSVFVRRIYLDIIGRIPTAREAEDFLDSTDPDKRSRLVGTLMAGDGYALNVFNYWADVLRLQQFGRIGSTAGPAYILWLKQALLENRPYDVMVRQLITARGLPWENGAIGYYMRDNKMPLDNFANTARIFLGTRIECAQCHDHPFDKWRQMDFYQMAAFTYGNEVIAYTAPSFKEAQLRVAEMRTDLARRFPEEKAKADPALAAKREAELLKLKFIGQSVNDVQVLSMGGVGVYHDPARALALPHDYQYDDAKPLSEVAPKTIMGAPAAASADESAVEAYARWLTSPDNPRFTTVIANRLWKMAFGLALIEPLDELTDQTVPVNPELMRRLEKLVRDSGYDMKQCLTAIFHTRAYQSECAKEEVPPGTPYAFTGPVLRRMSAEQLWDSVVNLITPIDDSPSVSTTQNLANMVSRSGKVIAGYDLLTAAEVFQGAVAAAESYRAAADFATRTRTEIEGLRGKKDHAAADALLADVMQAQAAGRRALGRVVFLPAVERLDALKEGRPAPPSPFSDQLPMVTREQLTEKAADPLTAAYALKVRGFDKSPLTPEEEQAALDRDTAYLLAEAAHFNVPEAKRQAYVASRRSARLYWKRAADHLSPAFRGHYLRIFGQSDRELIENSSRDASIPQALTMMNSDLLQKVLNEGSHLKLSIQRHSDPDAQFEAVYLALLSRQPTDRERAAWKNAQSRGLESIDDLIYALINTRRFIFNP